MTALKTSQRVQLVIEITIYTGNMLIYKGKAKCEIIDQKYIELHELICEGSRYLHGWKISIKYQL